MSAFFKYATVLVLGLAAGLTAQGPLSLDDRAKRAWLDEIENLVDKAFRPELAAIPIDQAGAASIDEELDYRIAQRIGSLEGWRSFLAAHGAGRYGQSAQEEVDKLLPSGKGFAGGISNGPYPDAKAALPAPPATGGAPPPSTAVGDAAPTDVAALPSSPEKVGSTPSLARRATGLPSWTRWAVSLHSHRPRLHAERCFYTYDCRRWRKAPNLPPLFLALMGERPMLRFARTASNTRPASR
jgi:hypothetical protein